MTTTPDAEVLHDLDFDYTPQCEHSDHQALPKWHDDGPARWFQHGRTLPCGHDSPGKLVCEAWKAYVETIGWTRCKECHASNSCEDARYTPIEG